jgi:hypothetical protein
LTSDIIRRFNRDTGWLASLVVGALVTAALGLAVLVQERHPQTNDLIVGASQAERDLLPNGKSFIGKVTSGQASSADPAIAGIPVEENSSSQMESGASASNPVLAFPTEIRSEDARSNVGSSTSGNRQDSGRVIGSKVPHARSRLSLRPRIVDVKMRLIALWHQSLARSERSRSWNLFANASRGKRKKVNYTVETNH